MDKEALRLRFRDEFRSSSGEAFQSWFEKLARAIHGEDCFLPIRVTRGDGGLDGLVLKSGLVYQVFAPPTMAKDATSASKIASDFAAAKTTLDNDVVAWTFVHNSTDGKLGHLSAAALERIRKSGVSVAVLGIDDLWTKLSALSDSLLEGLFGHAPTATTKSRVKALLNLAQSNAHEDDQKRAIELMKEAQAIAQAEGAIALEAEVLIGLCLLSSKQRGNGDRSHYMNQLERKITQVQEPIVLAMAHRARASVHHEQRDEKREEECLRAAISILEPLGSSDSALEQLCVVRSEYAHLLCHANRLEEAKCQVDLAETYALQHPDEEAGELLLAALGAGTHWAAMARKTGDIVDRTTALEKAANTAFRALRTADQLLNVANNLSREEMHSEAVAAAESALRLAYLAPRDVQESFLPGALYTVAVANFHAGHESVALAKAKALMDLPISPDTKAIRQAAAQLVSVIARNSGDTLGAVEAARSAVDAAQGLPSRAMAMLNLAISLGEHGEIDRALTLVEDAQELLHGDPRVPLDVVIEFLGRVAEYSALLAGKEARLLRALGELEALEVDDSNLHDRRKRVIARARANAALRSRILEISPHLTDTGSPASADQLSEEVMHFSDPSTVSVGSNHQVPQPRITSLQEANAATVAPLLAWWDDSSSSDPQAAALDLDYWARGAFAQILRNLGAFPNTVNIVLEVRSMSDVKRAIRLWGMYADFMMLLWKGPTNSGKFLHLVDGKYFGPWGAGYILTLAEYLPDGAVRPRVPAIGYASWLPPDVATFMVNEGRGFIESGRLLVVPASAVGCVSPGFGAMEQLVADAANAMSGTLGLRRDECAFGPLPYSPDMALDALLEFIQARSDDLLRMRSLLHQRASYFKANGLLEAPSALRRDIADALTLMRSLQANEAHSEFLKADEHVGFAMAPFRGGRSKQPQARDDTFIPLLTLESMGYGWKIDAKATAAKSDRYEPAAGEAIGAWLVPAEPGMQFAFVKKVS